MTEEKITYVTDYAYSGNTSEPKQKHSTLPEKPTDLPLGSAPPPLNLTINGKPLSTKQLYEIITSKNITIDKLLTDRNDHVNALQNIYDCLERKAYNKAKIIIEDTLKNIK